MEIRNTIDVQQLEITPQDADNTYLGIDENGHLVRTKIELSGTGGEGFKNLIERDVFPTKIVQWDGIVEEYTLTDEQRAYNIATYEMGSNDTPPILIYNGMIFQMSSGRWDSSGEGEVAFSQVVGDVNLMDEIGVMQLLYNQDGDVEFTIKLYNVGGGDVKFKTINGESIIGEGDIELLTMSSYNFLKAGIDINTEKINDIEDDIDNIYTKTEIGDIINSYYTKTEIDDMIGDINNILETI